MNVIKMLHFRVCIELHYYVSMCIRNDSKNEYYGFNLFCLYFCNDIEIGLEYDTKLVM